MHGPGPTGCGRPTVRRVSRPPTPPPPGPAPPSVGARFLTLEQVAEELTVSRAQVYALVRDRSLVALKIGGRGVWRVERSRLEDYITGLYRAAESGNPSEMFVDDRAGQVPDQHDGRGGPGAA